MLILCEGCKRHVRAEDATCPFCAATRDRSPVWTPSIAVRSRAAFLLGGVALASVAGCDKPQQKIEQVTAAPPYGMTADPTHDVPIPIPTPQPVVADAGPGASDAGAKAPDAGAAADAGAKAADAGAKATPTSAAPLYGMPPPRSSR